MSTWVDIASIATPIVMGVGFFIAWRQFDAIRRQRMAEIALKLSERWDSFLLEKSRQKLQEQITKEKVKEAIIAADQSQSKELYPLLRVGNFFDTVGALVVEGYLDKKIAYDLLAPPFKTYYALYSALLDDPTYGNYFQCTKNLDAVFTKITARHSKIKARRT